LKKFRKSAFDVDGEYELPHTFNKERKFAGGKWFYEVLERTLNSLSGNQRVLQ
jgi:hypothetical protein